MPGGATVALTSRLLFRERGKGARYTSCAAYKETITQASDLSELRQRVQKGLKLSGQDADGAAFYCSYKHGMKPLKKDGKKVDNAFVLKASDDSDSADDLDDAFSDAESDVCEL